MFRNTLFIASLLGALVIHSCIVQLAICTSNFTDQTALLAFKNLITLDPNKVLSNWRKETNFCSWVGVSCSRRRQRVTGLILRDMSLQGTLSPHVGNLSFLQELDLRNNSIRGRLMDEIGHLHRLKELVLENNMMEGDIPVGLHWCRRLQVISLAANNFSGGIPKQLGTLPFLRELYLGTNNLTGMIPPSFGNLSGLELIGLEYNNIYGNIPTEFALLPNLKEVDLERNHLTGSIPHVIFNKSSILEISLAFNALTGSLPKNSGIWLPNLNYLGLHINKLTGEIPSYFSNSSYLAVLALSTNLLTGPIPKSLGNLKLLQKLYLGDNQLTNERGSTELGFLTSLTNCMSLVELEVSMNPLSGTLPNSIGNFSTSLQVLLVQECQIMSQIPKAIGSLRNLIFLTLAGNNLNGSIPTSIGELKALQVLDLRGNNFHGSIPNEICLLSNLGEMYLQANKLSGLIPSCIANLSRLQVISLSLNKLTVIPMSLWNLENLILLDLSFNSLGGSLDPSIRTLKQLGSMDLSGNQISGNIPNIIGSFQSLTSLNLSNNSFSGPIPNSLGDLITLDFLELSHNNLFGPIPKSLEALSHVVYLNLSYNKLSGEIPSGGAFTNLTALSFIENEALCGKPIFQVPPCKGRKGHSSQKARTRIRILRYILPAIALTFVVFSTSLLYAVKRRRGNDAQRQHLNDLNPTTEHRMISYQELRNATNDFCEANLLGVGSYGSVYKGVLLDGTIVAVKVLNLQLEGAFKSFDAECKVLRTTRHRNLVKVRTTCSNHELRALVLQYMSNGSLEKWLYSHNYCLDLLQRISIMTDVALAMEYLHNGQEIVVHCDLKPSNVLLDEDMVAHVADFGIAKILAENKTVEKTKTLATLGYIAPEYGSEGRVSTSGDVYSYGIMLLETFTRKKPMDEMFAGEFSLRQWVSTSVPDNVLEVIDRGLLTTLNGGDEVATKENLVAILELGLECSRELPTERSDIREVISKLNKIKRQLIRIQSI